MRVDKFHRLSLLFVLIGLFILPLKGLATHLIGGSMGYTFVGPDPGTPGNDLYLISFQAYMDCNSANWSPGVPGGFPEQSIEIGVYTGQLTDPNLPLSQTLDIDLVTFNIVQPNIPPGCTFTTNSCVAVVLYEATISLSPNATGYHLLYDRCCRPGGILNLQNSGSQSLTYKVYIPSFAGPTGITNSTPIFTDTLSSFLCVGDTTFLQNGAVDPDGDSLVYDFEIPFDGVTSQVSPVPNYGLPAFDPYPNPPSVINWGIGYNLNNMFGAAGFQSINAQTGVTAFSATTAGVYVAAVEIREYRNNVLISVTRRDIQILAVACPTNPTPTQDTVNLDPAAVDPQTYIINEGENVCIDLNYFDPNGDTIDVQASGSVFDVNQISPNATITAPTFSDSSITAQFCWPTSCSQGRTQPYTFNVTVTDQGCPPKEFVESYSILVIPFDGPTFLTGDTLVCGDSIGTYTTDQYTGATYNWTVTGGTIISGAGTSNIQVDWGAGPTGTVSVNIVSAGGCPEGPLSLNVNISQATADAGPNQFICTGDTVVIGGAPTGGAGTSTLIWDNGTTLNNPNLANPVASPTTTTTYTVTVTDTVGCVDTSQVTVTVNTLLETGLDDDYFLCPGDTLDLSPNNTTAQTWTPTTNVTNPAGPNPRFHPLSAQQYALVYTDLNNCIGRDTIFVNVDPEVPTNAGPDLDICAGDTVQLGSSPTSPPNTTYSWSPGASLNNTSIGNPNAFPTVTTSYIVETFNDTCTGRDTVQVIVNPNPVISTSNDTLVCRGDTIQVEVFGTGDVVWDNSLTLSDDTLSNPQAFPNSSTLYVVTLTDANGCSSEDSVRVDVQPIPLADAGGVITRACKLVPEVLGGNPAGPTGATYSWSPITELNDPTLANPTVVTDTDRVYTLVVTDTIGCVNSDSTTVRTMRITPAADSTLCQGDTFLITSSAINGFAPYTPILSPSTLILPSGTTGTPFSGFIASQTETYELVVQDSLGCTDTVSFTANVLEQATASFDFESSNACDGKAIFVQNSSLNVDQYNWFLNGSQISAEVEPELLLAYGQNYTLQLVTLNNSGCNDTQNVVIPVGQFTGEFDLTVPNVFTPNGDGVNDYFELPSFQGLEECIDMQVFNRWGQLIYESTGDVHSWDGRTFTGEVALEGVYFYIFDIRGNKVTGSVNLLR